MRNKMKNRGSGSDIIHTYESYYDSGRAIGKYLDTHTVDDLLH